MEYVSPEGLRVDGRRPRELRRINCQLDVLSSADGSAIFEMGNTKVLAAVFGPHAVTKRSDLKEDAAVVVCEYSMAAFSTGERRRRGKGDRRSTELSMVIRNTLEQAILTELMPRSQIDVYVQVLQADGGTRCAAINAAVLALSAAGVPLRDLVASVAAGHLDGTPLLDLNFAEDSGGGPDLAVALAPRLGQLVLVQMDSRLPVDTFQAVLDLARDGCRTISGVMREALLEHTKRLAVARGMVTTSS
ncbi:Exosome complex component rrp41 [Pleodorina starrii]|uniref:Exosome complex component rrp41 n=1 Tax=Pleodorina starrii TaxID=330485 RepID=A0A9W6BRQ6_9CHLO|nr:Exosome complex component rrp41 [Pleodorina starrii]GLC56301.1 Exosome complex component rrp41 [Pleodorina starrii]GLC69645.1 Exosome complex component rrp41 [Pleodorina starrii]